MNMIFASSWEQVSINVLFWLIHFGWIGFLVGAVGWFADRALSNATPKQVYRRSVCWFLLLVAGAFVAVLLSSVTAPQIARVDSVAIDQPEAGHVQSRRSDEAIAEPANTSVAENIPILDMDTSDGSADAFFESPVEIDTNSKTENENVSVTTSVATDLSSEQILASVAIIVSVIYLLGAVLMLIRLALAGWGCRRLVRSSVAVTDLRLLELVQNTASQLGLKITPVLATCERVIVPVVFGLIRPAILLPASIITELTPDQIRAILAHEMAHLKRYDHLVVVFQRIVEAFLFFHPTTWWFSRHMDLQRESCCDDLVLQSGTSRIVYAETLYAIACSRKNSETPIGAEERVALAADGASASEILIRISRVLNEQVPSNRSTTNNFWAANFGVGLFMFALPVLLLINSYLGQNKTSSSILAPLDPVEQYVIDNQRDYGVIRGVIRNEEGDLVAGATVILQEYPGKYLPLTSTSPSDPQRANVPPIVFAKTKTEMDGEFEFSDIKIPDYQKYFDSPFPITILVVHDDYGMTWRHLKTRSVQKIEYKLKKGSAISFKAESNTGQPLQNVTARLFGVMTTHDWNNVHPYRRVPCELIHQGATVNPAVNQQSLGLIQSPESDSGSFSTDKANSDMIAVVTVGADDHVTEPFYVTNVDVGKTSNALSKNDYAPVLANGSTIKLRKIVKMKLRVTDQAGKPTAGVELDFNKHARKKNKMRPVVTEGKTTGEFSIDVATKLDGNPFRIDLMVKPSHGPFLNYQQSLEIDPTKTNQTFHVELTKGVTIQGKVIDADSGAAIEGVRVGFRPANEKNPKSDDPSPRHRASFGSTNADGQFRLNLPLENGGRATGSLFVLDKVEGYQTWTKDENNVGQLITANVDPALDAEPVLKLPSLSPSDKLDSFQVKVLDENGKPAPRATVRFQCTYTNGNTGLPKTQKTDQQGLLQMESGALLRFRKIGVVIVSEDQESAGTAVFNRPKGIETMEEIVSYMKELREGLKPDEPTVVLTASLQPIASISGRVIDASTDQAIPFAKVRSSQYFFAENDVLKSSFHLRNFFPFVEADENGVFELKAIPNLRCKLEALHGDYLNRREFSDADYFLPVVGEAIERNPRLAPKAIGPDAKIKPLVVPELGDRKGVEALQFLKNEFKSAQRDFRDRLSKGDAAFAQLAGHTSPATVYLPKIIEIADANRGQPAEVKALVWGCNILINSSEDQKFRYKLRTEIGNRLMKDYIQSPEILECMEHLIYSQPDPHAAAEKILAANKNKNVQGNALLLIGQNAVREISIRSNGHRFAKWCKNWSDKKLYEHAYKTYSRIKDEFPDVPYWRNENLGTIAEMQLFEFDHLGIGDEVEDIIGKDVDGLPLKLSDYRGKVVVLDFWGSWCGPCISDLPKLKKMAKDFEDDLVIVGVMNDTIQSAKKALLEHDVQWPNIVEPDHGPIQTRWNIDSWPTMFLIDTEGKIISKSLRGQQLYDAIEEHLEKRKDTVGSNAGFTKRDERSFVSL